MTKKPHILMVSSTGGCGGTEMYILNLLDALEGSYDFSVLLGEDGFLRQQLETRGVPHHLEPAIKSEPRRHLIPALHEREPDLVHLHDTRMAAKCSWQLAGFPAPCVLSGHQWDLRLPARPLPSVVRNYYSCARMSKHLDAIVCNADYWRRLLSKVPALRRDSLVTIHNWLPWREPETTPRTDGQVRLLMVARFSRPKQPARLLKAYADIYDRLRVPSSLTMVGCGSPAIERQCRHIAEKHLPKEAVEFAGETYPTDKVVANSDVCVLTTDHETCPLVLLEAMRAGKPVIASAVTGIPEQVQSGYNGFLISSSLELRQALYRLLEEPDLRQDMGAKGRKMFEAMFCDRQAVPKIRDLFDRLL